MGKLDLVCDEFITPRRLKSQNIIHRIRQRELGPKRATSSYLNVREFYKNIFPNYTVFNVEKPPCYLRKFSPDGQYLIAFSLDQTALEIYRYQGMAAAGQLLSASDETGSTASYQEAATTIRCNIFDKLFKQKYVVKMDQNDNQQLNRECSLFTNDGKYVILGAAVFVPEDVRPNYYDLYSNNEAITPTTNCPLEDYTLYLIDIQNGLISDSAAFKSDKIALSHNQGLYLYKDTLAVLSIHHQTIHLFRIINGQFRKVQSIGRFCGEEERYLHTDTMPHGEGLRSVSEPTINSLKHKILVFLFRAAKRLADAGDQLQLRKFFQYFDEYRLLRMWKMQLLDENHLLIKYSSEDVVTLKVAEPNSQASFFVIFNINDNRILSVYNNTSKELLYLFENFCDMFRNCDSPYICSPSNNIYANLMHQRFKQTIIGAKGGGAVEATKRLLAQLPISAQSYSCSPYLDLSLFSYDDKFVSVMERPKPACNEYPIRFFARDSGLLKFSIVAGLPTKQPPPASARRLVAFTFHPTEPFAISVQRVNTDYIANFHIRHATLPNVRVN